MDDKTFDRLMRATFLKDKLMGTKQEDIPIELPKLRWFESWIPLYMLSERLRGTGKRLKWRNRVIMHILRFLHFTLFANHAQKMVEDNPVMQTSHA